MTSTGTPPREKLAALWLALLGTAAGCFCVYLAIATLVTMLMWEFADAPQHLGSEMLAAPSTGAILAVVASPIMFRLSRRRAWMATAFLLLCVGVIAWSRWYSPT